MYTPQTIAVVTPIRAGRTRQENQERAYIAASRRSDRPLDARLESARHASRIHKSRTGRSLRITEQAVLNEEIYEEDINDFHAISPYAIAHLHSPAVKDGRGVIPYLAKDNSLPSSLSAVADNDSRSGQLTTSQCNTQIPQYSYPEMPPHSMLSSQVTPESVQRAFYQMPYVQGSHGTMHMYTAADPLPHLYHRSFASWAPNMAILSEDMNKHLVPDMSSAPQLPLSSFQSDSSEIGEPHSSLGMAILKHDVASQEIPSDNRQQARQPSNIDSEPIATSIDETGLDSSMSVENRNEYANSFTWAFIPHTFSNSNEVDHGSSVDSTSCTFPAYTTFHP